ncbi:signal peptide, CUB and EGF-like domain-containing protein 2 [Nematostella vectensis]|uniref:signal peptide, CUB and EGF-like domain-containing protein 2 n=1 Tax=Nematostella vectensis TaxID=45351 RepID=UPI002077758C|nr:signal peptide, CUB and EGF-like domain-containing protein 2 [Nematostella vectensis]
MAWIVVAAGCHPGMYFDIFLRRCVNCTRGSFQSQRSETFCFRCPGNKTTLYSGTRDLSQCRETKCGGNLTSMSGVITSPNYPDAYPRFLECTWTIHPRRGRNILLLIPSISLPTTPDCSDYLTMRESSSPYSVFTYYACESFDQPVALVSRSKNLHIKFKSSQNSMAEGFKIFYVTFEERFRNIVKHIVEDGELYANETNRRLLQDETLVRQILDVIVDPSSFEYSVSSNRLHSKIPSGLLKFIENKVYDFFSNVSPYRKKRATQRSTFV